jgi:acyl-CoA oxidase
LDASWKTLGQALTIIVRYSLQRTQFKDKTGKEIPILNYQLQQSRIIPMVAEMYANMFGSKRILAMAQDNVKRIKENNDFSKMLVQPI